MAARTGRQPVARRRIARWAVGSSLVFAVLTTGCADPPSSSGAPPTDPRALALQGVPAGLRRAGRADLFVEGGVARTRPAAPTARGLSAPADVSIPLRAGSAFEVRDVRSGVGAAIRRLAQDDGAPERTLGDGLAIERDADGAARVLFRTTDHGLEDFVRVDDPSGPAEVAFALDLSRVAGLRLVSSVLELLDEGGAPRLRARQPRVIDADGRESLATLDVEGCAVDRSPAPPWRRAVQPPGAAQCKVVVRWSPDGLRYPVWVDPYWTTTANELVWPHEVGAHGALLGDGSVLFVGGMKAPHPEQAVGAERFDPESETWAVTADVIPHPALIPGTLFAMTTLADGRAMFVAPSLPTMVQLYDPASGTWSETTSPVSEGQSAPCVVGLLDGRALLTWDPGTEPGSLFDPATATWTAVAATMGRNVQGMTRLDDGSVLVLGLPFGTDRDRDVCVRFRPDAGTGSWEPCRAPGMLARDFAMSHLPDDRVVIAGGRRTVSSAGDEKFIFHVFVYTPAEDQWIALNDLPDQLLPPVDLVDGTWWVVGGQFDNSKGVLATTLHYDDGPAQSWVRGPAMNEGRAGHLSIALADGRALVAGGKRDPDYLLTAELLDPGLADGAPCELAVECLSAVCTEGVCCDVACDDPCLACTAFAKVSGPNGICGPARSCSATCDSSVDCVDGQVCSAERVCVDAAPAASTDPGCTSARGQRGGWQAMLAVAAIAVAMVRRRGRSSGSCGRRCRRGSSRRRSGRPG